ncbi:MAG: hypothetical protein LRY71_08500 [Bacillaceae bacterium]|nr:hypothetical protein [Bacillaceae bacterium]
MRLFRANLTLRARKRQHHPNQPEWLLDHKVHAYSFIDQFNVTRPWVSDTYYALKNIPQKEGVVIKPLDGAGSRGVYLVFGLHNIQDVKQAKKIEDWDTLVRRMEEDLRTKKVVQDQWIVEELICDENSLPARDIKFYCFYGRVGLILEVVRYPEVKYCWWTPEGKRVQTGKYDDNLFKGWGVSEEERNLAASISAEIPTPFIRIDFLKTSKRLVFGEFTPKPGNYDEFDDQTDQQLGDLFLEAESRLFHDLLQGKQFSNYQRLFS